MQAVLDEIHRVTKSTGLVVPEAGLSVAYERSIDLYLTECLALAVTAASKASDPERIEFARTLEPEWTRQLEAGQPLLPAGVAGARLGLYMCALGMCPFETLDGVVAMDSLTYRVAQLTKLFNWFRQQSMIDDKDAQKPRGRVLEPMPPEDTRRGHLRAEMPIEFLIAMIRMLHHTGVTKTLYMSLSETNPPWYDSQKPEMSVAKGVSRRESNRGQSEWVYTASLASPSAASALMRAVVVVEMVRQHVARGSPEDTALPMLLDWDIHKAVPDSMDTLITNFGFSVLVARKEATKQDDGDARLNAFMAALFNATGAFPTAVPTQTTALDQRGRLVMLLDVFIGAQWPGLPQYEITRPMLWRQRRSNPANPETWLTASVADRPVDDTGKYHFDTSVHVAHSKMVQARIGRRLAVNRWCRRCAEPLASDAKSLTCAMGKCIN